VRGGTGRALLQLGLSIEASITIRTNAGGEEPQLLMQYSDWHNGYFIAVVRKSPAIAAPNRGRGSNLTD